MLHYKNILPLAALLFLFSCERDEVDVPSFEVRAEKAEYKVGDSVQFTFSGEPDIITFYSGEAGKEYQYKDRTNAEGGKTELDFVSRVLYGSQENNMRVVSSSDFIGTYDSANVKKATWKDITSRFTLPTAAAGGLSADLPSGKADISDLVVTGKPLFLAFQYVGAKPPGTAATQRTWRVTAFNLTSTMPGKAPSSLATLTSAAWLAVDVINPANKWAISNTMLQLAPNGTLLETEDWVITKPIYVTKVAPDKGTAIKEYSQRKDNYTYVFATAGTYTITFVASNTGSKAVKTVVKDLKLTILP